MTVADLLHVISIVAASNGLLVALVLLVRQDARSMRLRVTLGGFLFLTSGLLGLFVLLDRGLVTYVASLGVGMDAAAILLSCLFLDYVITLARGRGWWPAYAPLAAYVLLILALGGRPGEATDMRVAIFTQIAMTASAGAVYAHALAHRPEGWRRRAAARFLPVLFAGMGLLHVTQLARLAAPDAPWLFDLVPLTGAVYLSVVLVYALLGSRILTDLVRPAAVDAPQAGLAAALQRELVEARRFLDADLSLQGAADAVGVEPRRLSGFLNDHEGVSFRRYLNRLRIDEARRLLRSPEEAATSIEAIALLSGFRSRSAFYEAFKLETGLSPQQYREQSADRA